jgi:predicted Zn-dependent protease
MHRLLLIVIFFLVGCATVGVPVSDTELRKEAIDLKQKAELYRIEQEKRIIEIGTKLLKLYPDPLPLEFKYKRSPIINAYCSGKKIVIFEGLISTLKSDDELAMILAHEIGHAVRNHVAKSMLASIPGLILGIGLSVVTGVNVTQPVMDITTKPYARSLETEADFIGTLLAYEAGYDPLILPKVMERIAIRFGDTKLNKYGRTHPPTPQRTAMIKKELEALQNGKLIPDIVFSILSRKSSLPCEKYTKEQLIDTCKFIGYSYEEREDEIIKVKIPRGSDLKFLLSNGKVVKMIE